MDKVTTDSVHEQPFLKRKESRSGIEPSAGIQKGRVFYTLKNTAPAAQNLE